MNLLEAMESADVFGPAFKRVGDVDTWANWRAFGGCLMGLPLPADLAELARVHTGRSDLPGKPFSEAALVIGRRGGKSRVLATVAVYLATFRDYGPHLAPGEVATIAIIAADRRQARSIFRFTLGLLQATPMLAGLVTDSTAETITLSNRVVIEIAIANFQVTRGYTYAAVLADEVSWWRSEDSANPDEEIFRALRPGMLTIPGAMLICASSPYRKRGVLWNAYKRSFGVNGARILVWQATSSQMNPSLDVRIIEEAYEDDPQAAAAEYGARFRDDLSDFVSRDAVIACIEPGRTELPPAAGLRYKAFVDMSGGGADSAVLAIAHSGQGGVGVLDLAREIKGPSSPEAAVVEFSAILKTYGLSIVTGDMYGGLWPTERYKGCGVTYVPSELPKSAIFQNLLPLLNSPGKLQLLDQPRLVNQFASLERRTSISGKDQISHPPGPNCHDDVANAAAGALLQVAGKRSNIELWTALAS